MNAVAISCNHQQLDTALIAAHELLRSQCIRFKSNIVRSQNMPDDSQNWRGLIARQYAFDTVLWHADRGVESTTNAGSLLTTLARHLATGWHDLLL